MSKFLTEIDTLQQKSIELNHFIRKLLIAGNCALTPPT